MKKFVAAILMLPLSLCAYGFKEGVNPDVEKVPVVSPCVKDNSCVAPKVEKEAKDRHKTRHDKGETK